MRHEDGSEVLVTLALPLDIRLMADLANAIDLAARQSGYDQVAILTDGTNRVVARKTNPGDAS